MSQNAPSAPHKVEIVAHYVDAEKTRIEIEWMYVPESERGNGLGAAAYEMWEQSLDPSVKLVTLFAADTGGQCNSDPFWEKLGFDWVYTADDADVIPYEQSHRMHKGVNGHPTPKAVWWGEDEDDEPEPLSNTCPGLR